MKIKKYIIYIIFLALIAFGLGTGWFSYASEKNANSEQKPIENTRVLEEEKAMIQIEIDDNDVELIAKTVYGEARGCSVVEQSAVVWCILNRVDAGYGTIEEVITAPYQFTGYNANHPVKAEFVELAIDVLLRWNIEKYCIGDVGRTLPNNYLFFHGDGKKNHFRDAFDGEYNVWEWQAINPYP